MKNLVEHHDIAKRKTITPHGVRKMVHAAGKEAFPLLIEVMEADNAAKAPEKQDALAAETDALRAAFEQIIAANDPVDLKDFAVTGTDLIACGIPAGKEIGDVLERMLRDVLRVPEHNTKAYLLDPSNIRQFLSMQDKRRTRKGAKKQAIS